MIFLQLRAVGLLIGGGAVENGRQAAEARQQVADLTLERAHLSVRVVHAGLDVVVEVRVAHLAERSLPVHTVGLSRAHHLAGHHDADLTDASNVGVEQTALNLFRCEGGGESLARSIDHAVGHTHGLGENAAKADTGEDVHVVALSGVVGAGLAGGVGEGHGGERRAGGEETATVSVLDGILKVTLGLGGRIGQREDDGSGVPVGHLAEDLGGEDTTQSGETHQDGGLDMLDDLLQSLELLALIVPTSEVNLVVGELVTAVGSDETLGVDKVEAVARLILGHAFTHEKLHNLLGDADTGRAGAEENGTVVLARQAGALDSVDHTAQNHGTGTLNIVVEARVRVPIPLKCGERVLEIFELNDDAGESCVSRGSSRIGCMCHDRIGPEILGHG